MLQRAGASGNDSRGPPVPDGPPIHSAASSGSKGFSFTQLQ